MINLHPNGQRQTGITNIWQPPKSILHLNNKHCFYQYGEGNLRRNEISQKLLNSLQLLHQAPNASILYLL